MTAQDASLDCCGSIAFEKTVTKAIANRLILRFPWLKCSTVCRYLDSMRARMHVPTKAVQPQSWGKTTMRRCRVIHDDKSDPNFAAHAANWNAAHMLILRAVHVLHELADHAPNWNRRRDLANVSTLSIHHPPPMSHQSRRPLRQKEEKQSWQLVLSAC